MNEKIYAAYKGDRLLVVGTRKECLEFLGIKESTFISKKSPSYKKAAANRKRGYNNYMYIEEIEEEFPQIYAAYKGNQLLVMGTREECISFLNIRKEYFNKLKSPSYRRAAAERVKGRNNYLYVEEVE